MTTIFEKIAALGGQPSTATPDQVDWEPGRANGGLAQLLDELLVRGWKIEPPADA